MANEVSSKPPKPGAEGLRRVIEFTRTKSALAKHLGIKPQAVDQWGQIPAEHVHAVEGLTGIPRHELRPDLYPVERELLPTLSEADQQAVA